MGRLKESRGSLKEYIKYRSERAVDVIDRLTQTIELKGKNVLDIGCGYGNLAFCMARAGANVRAIDIDGDRIEKAKQYNKHDNVKYEATHLDSLNSGEFDVVTLFDVLEHVSEYSRLLTDVKDKVKKGGYVFIEYNPYYSFVGHHLYDYTFLPVQILPYSITKKLVMKKKDCGGIFSPESALKQFRDLNKITPKLVRALCKEKGFEIVYERNEINIPGNGSFSTKLFRKIPFVEDFFTFAHLLILKT